MNVLKEIPCLKQVHSSSGSIMTFYVNEQTKLKMLEISYHYKQIYIQTELMASTPGISEKINI